MTYGENQQKCVGTKINGEPCGAFALPHSQFCFSHDPNRKDEVKAARIKGSNSPKRSKADMDNRKKWRRLDRDELVRLMSEMVIRVTEDRMTNLNTAKALAYMVNVLNSVLDKAGQDELVARIKHLEEVILNRADG